MKEDKTLSTLMRSLPAEKPPVGLSVRIMERVAQEKSHAERRSERTMWVWTIALSALVLAAGGWVLYVSGGWPEFRPDELFAFRWRPISPQAAGMLRRLLPGAVVVLSLLIGDLYLRRWFFMRRYRKSEGEVAATR